MDLQVRAVEFLVAQSQVSLQSLFGLVEADTLSALLLHLGSQLIPLLVQLLQILLSEEQLGNSQATWSVLHFYICMSEHTCSALIKSTSRRTNVFYLLIHKEGRNEMQLHINKQQKIQYLPVLLQS